MLTDKSAPILVLIIGIGILLVSPLANVIGIGDDPGNGLWQATGTIVGVIITVVGLYLTLRSKTRLP